MNLIWFSTKEMAMFYKFLMRALMAMILSSVGGLAWAATDKEAGADWPNLAAYRSANAQLKSAENKVEKTIFMGDSITEFWTPSFWNATRINRGISGQTTPQMLLRFRSDVIELQPQMVVILAGTNDVAGNTGPATVDMIVGNIVVTGGVDEEGNTLGIDVNKIIEVLELANNTMQNLLSNSSSETNSSRE